MSSCPGRVSEAERDPGPSTNARRFICHIDFPVIVPAVPGLRSLTLARPGHVSGAHPRAKSRLAHEPLAVAHSRCQTAQCSSFPRRVVASGFVRLFACAFACASAGEFGTGGRRDSSNAVPPMRGGWSADRRTHSSVAPATRDHLSRGDRDLLSALHRGGFRLGATKPAPALGLRSLQRLPAPGHHAWRAVSRTSLARGYEPRRRTPLPAPPSGSSRKTPLHERGCKSYTINSLRSQ